MPAASWLSLALLALVVLGFFAFGVISLSTSLYVAIGVGFLAVAASAFVTGKGTPLTLFVFGGAGLVLLLGGNMLPPLTIADAAQGALTLVPGGDGA